MATEKATDRERVYAAWAEKDGIDAVLRLVADVRRETIAQCESAPMPAQCECSEAVDGEPPCPRHPRSPDWEARALKAETTLSEVTRVVRAAYWGGEDSPAAGDLAGLIRALVDLAPSAARRARAALPPVVPFPPPAGECESPLSAPKGGPDVR